MTTDQSGSSTEHQVILHFHSLLLSSALLHNNHAVSCGFVLQYSNVHI